MTSPLSGPEFVLVARTTAEAAIIAAMEQLMQDRTTFIIAHRLDTLEGCDLLLHLEDGHVRAIKPSELRATAAGSQ